MRHAYVAIGAFLLLPLLAATPRFSHQSITSSDLLIGIGCSTTIAQQVAQNDSNDSNPNPQPDQPGDNNGNGSSDNPDQLSNQP